jgi:chaperone required for assembly of F1-ATPase
LASSPRCGISVIRDQREREEQEEIMSAVSMIGAWMVGPGARRAAMWAGRSGARRGMAGGGGGGGGGGRGGAARVDKSAAEGSNKYAEKLEQNASAKKKADVPLAMLKADGSSKRFYNKAWIDEIKVDDPRTGNATTAFCLTLDGRLVRTPANKLLTLPNEIMGMAVALEFDVQGANIHPFTMPITTLATTAIDQIAKTQVGHNNPNTPQPKQSNRRPQPLDLAPLNSKLVTTQVRKNSVESMMRAFDSDLLCLRSSSPPELVALERQIWGEITDWMTTRFDMKVFPCLSLLPPLMPPHPLILNPCFFHAASKILPSDSRGRAQRKHEQQFS